MFFWFDRNDSNIKLPKVRPKLNNKHLSNNEKHVTFPEKSPTVVYPKYSPLPAINSKHPYRKLERQRTYVVTNPVFVKAPKQRKKPMTFKDFKKGLNKRNKNNNDDNGMIWIDL